jgi:hypothetical protein
VEHLIWDIDTLQTMTSLLRNASEQLQACKGDLKTLCADGEELFRENEGVSQRILGRMETLVGRTERVGEQSEALARALVQVREQFMAVENENRRMAENLPVNAETTTAHPRRSGILMPLPNKVLIPELKQSALGFVPSWLSEAASKALRL